MGKQLLKKDFVKYVKNMNSYTSYWKEDTKGLLKAIFPEYDPEKLAIHRKQEFNGVKFSWLNKDSGPYCGKGEPIGIRLSVDNPFNYKSTVRKVMFKNDTLDVDKIISKFKELKARLTEMEIAHQQSKDRKEREANHDGKMEIFVARETGLILYSDFSYIKVSENEDRSFSHQITLNGLSEEELKSLLTHLNDLRK